MEVIASSSGDAPLRRFKPADMPSTSRAHSSRVTEGLPATPKEHFLRNDSVPRLEDLIAGDLRLEELLKGDPEPSKQNVEEGDDDEDGGDFTSQIGCGIRGHSLMFMNEPPYSCGAFLCNMCTETGTSSVYHCEICKYDLCPECASSTTSSSLTTAVPNAVPEVDPTITPWPVDSILAQVTTTSSSQPLLSCGNPDHALELVPSAPYETASYVCNLCLKGGDEEVYHCMSCQDFDLHPDCARIAREIQSFTHVHRLVLQPQYSRGNNAICDGCLEHLGGSRWVYRCSSGCDFDLHALCAKFARKILSPIHPDHELVLHDQSLAGPNSYVMCDGCDGAVDPKELIYHCEDCGFDLHPLCAIGPDMMRS